MNRVLVVLLLLLFSFTPANSMNTAVLVKDVQENIFFNCDDTAQHSWKMVCKDFNRCYKSIRIAQKHYIDLLVDLKKEGKQEQFEQCIAAHDSCSRYVRRAIGDFLGCDDTLENNNVIYMDASYWEFDALSEAIRKKSVLGTYLCIKQNIDNLKIGGKPAFFKAASYGHTNIVKLFLDMGVDIDSRESMRRTVLSVDYEQNSNAADMFTFLLDHGANPNAIDDDGITVLTLAIMDQGSDIVKRLIDHKNTNINALSLCYSAAGFRTPLITAIDLRRSDIVQLLLAHKDINPSIKDENGLTAFDWEKICSDEIHKLLREFKKESLVNKNRKDEDEKASF